MFGELIMSQHLQSKLKLLLENIFKNEYVIGTLKLYFVFAPTRHIFILKVIVAP
jgi:hypothetical protein